MANPCTICKLDFVASKPPRIVQCCHITLCSRCIRKSTKNRKYKCRFCTREIDSPESGFPFNRNVANQLLSTDLHTKTGELLHLLCLNNEFEEIETHYKRQEKLINSKTEEKIEGIAKHETRLLEQLKTYENECNENHNQMNKEKSEKLIKKIDALLEEEIETENDNAMFNPDETIDFESLKEEVENLRFEMKQTVFGGALLQFVEIDTHEIERILAV